MLRTHLGLPVLVSLLVSISTPTSAQTFDFKGLVLGSRVDARTLEEKFNLTCRNYPAGGGNCNGKTTFLGMEAMENVAIDKNNMVVDITVRYSTTTVWPKDIAAELMKKFGLPKHQRQNMIFDWINGSGQRVHLEHRELRMTTPRVVEKEAPPNLKKKDL